MSEVTTVGVVGSGTMGNGIAHVFALAGYQVVLMDVDEEALQRGVDTISGNLDRQVSKSVISGEEKQRVLASIRTVTEPEGLEDVDFVVEAATEKESVKFEIFDQLDSIVREEVILATNTSSISITEIAAETDRPDQVIGMHFMNPVPVMELVEVIRGLATNDATTEMVMDLAEELGKTPVEVQDYPGFISNRILMPMINEAVFCLMEGVGSKEAIDNVMRLGMGHPMGPIQLADFIGLDVCLSILNVLHEGLGEDKYRPCPLLRKMVASGRLGRKSGRGFYNYSGD